MPHRITRAALVNAGACLPGLDEFDHAWHERNPSQELARWFKQRDDAYLEHLRAENRMLDYRMDRMPASEAQAAVERREHWDAWLKAGDNIRRLMRAPVPADAFIDLEPEEFDEIDASDFWWMVDVGVLKLDDSEIPASLR